MMITINTEQDAVEAYLKAVNYEENGRFEDALELRKALFKYSPTEAKIIISMGESFYSLGMHKQAEQYYRKAIKLHPKLELASLRLFHFLWDRDLTDQAFEEMKRFQTVSHSDDYMEIVREINKK